MEANLIEGEEVVFSTTKHWAAPLADSKWAILMIIGAFALGWFEPARTDGLVRPSGPLEPRTQAILRAVIEEYVSHRRSPSAASARRALRPGRQLGDRAQRPGRARGSRLPEPPAHQRRPRADRRRLPVVRRVAGAGGQPGARRAADDPPPVRPGRVRQRAVVPPGGGDARRRTHAAGLATPAKPRRLPPAPRRPGRDQPAGGQPGRRPGRGLGQAGAVAARRAGSTSTARRDRPPAQRRADRQHRRARWPTRWRSSRPTGDAALPSRRRAHRAADARVRRGGRRGRLLRRPAVNVMERPSSPRARSCAASSARSRPRLPRRAAAPPVAAGATCRC
jgi:hypothetical protein